MSLHKARGILQFLGLQRNLRPLWISGLGITTTQVSPADRVCVPKPINFPTILLFTILLHYNT